MTGTTQRLFCDDSQRSAVLARAQVGLGHDFLRRWQSVLRTADDTVPAIEAGFHAAGQAIWAWLHDDAVAAQAAAELVAGTINDRWLHVSNHAPAGVPLWAGSYKMIMRTDPAVGVAIALSYAGDRWDPSFRSEVADKLLSLAEELLRGGGEGWTDSIVSNWHANTRSAVGLCAMALQGLIDEGRRQELLIAAKTGCDAFMATGGERGWHQESWHYYRYALGHHLLPFACAWRHRIDRDAFCLGDDCMDNGRADDGTDESPLPWTPLLYPFVRIGQDAVVPHRQRPLAPTHFHSGELAMGAGLLGPDQASALAWELVDRCGAAGDATWDIRYGHHALLALLHVPEVTLSGAEAQAILGHFWQDETKGLYVWRQQFGGARALDASGALVVDANRASKPGTGRPTCAGAFTFATHGHVWAHGAMGKWPGRQAYNCTHTDGQNTLAGATTIAVEGAVPDAGRIHLDCSAVHPDADADADVGSPSRIIAVQWYENGDADLQVQDELGVIGSWTWHGSGVAERTTDGWSVQTDDGCVLSVVVQHGADMQLETTDHGYRVTLFGSRFAIAATVRRTVLS